MSDNRKNEPSFAGGDVPPCFHCRHLLTSGPLGTKAGWTCKAYPDGIPLMVLDRVERHDKPLPYDGGYQFDPEPYVDGQGRVWQMDWWGRLHEDT